MKRIRVLDLKEGIMFTKPVYFNNTNIFVGPNIRISDKDIQRLVKWRIDEVQTEGELINPSEANASVSGVLSTETVSKIKTEKNEEDLLNVSDFFKKPLSNIDFDEEEKRLITEGIDKRYVDLRNRALKVVADVIENVRQEKLFNTDAVKEIVNSIVIELEKNKRPFLILARRFIPGEYYISHSVNTSMLSLIMGNALKFSRIKQMSLGLGAILHDIGMMKLPLRITNKQGKLSEEEYNIIKTHPILGYKVLMQDGKFTQDVVAIVLQHHERLDGKGYPRKIKGEQITELTKIVQVSSVYLAMISKRSYREGHQYFDAMRQLLNGCQGEFDPKFLKLFLSIMSYYPIGSYVELSDKRVCEVIASNPKLPLKPVVKVVIDEKGMPIRVGEEIELASHNNIYIVKPFEDAKVESLRHNYGI